MTLRRSRCPYVFWLIASVVLIASSVSGILYHARAQTDSPIVMAQASGAAKPGIESRGEITVEAIIHPYRSASVGAEVGGLIETVRFNEGDPVEKSQVVAEISKRRYQVLADKASDALKAMELAHKRALQEVAIKTELLAKNAITRQELLKAETEADIAATKVEETRKDLTLAQLNLEDCQLKAPFTGYLAVRYKQPFETVQRLDKVFAVIDTSRVQVVSSVRGDIAAQLEKGAQAVFEDNAGRKHQGKVDKVARLTDPKTGTARVYVLIDNPNGEIRVGTAGTLKLSTRGAR
jgi:RND family efflux transporter MFP subunit